MTQPRRHRRTTAAAAVVVALAATLIVVTTGAAPLCWGHRCDTVNAFRADHDRPGLDQVGWLQESANGYADDLSRFRVLRHGTWVDYGTGRAEIIGFGPDWATILTAWRRSSCRPGGTWPGPCPGHREILLDRDLEQLGIGCDRDPLQVLWCVVRFR